MIFVYPENYTTIYKGLQNQSFGFLNILPSIMTAILTCNIYLIVPELTAKA